MQLHAYPPSWTDTELRTIADLAYPARREGALGLADWIDLLCCEEADRRKADHPPREMKCFDPPFLHPHDTGLAIRFLTLIEDESFAPGVERFVAYLKTNIGALATQWLTQNPPAFRSEVTLDRTHQPNKSTLR